MQVGGRAFALCLDLGSFLRQLVDQVLRDLQRFGKARVCLVDVQVGQYADLLSEAAFAFHSASEELAKPDDGVRDRNELAEAFGVEAFAVLVNIYQADFEVLPINDVSAQAENGRPKVFTYCVNMRIQIGESLQLILREGRPEPRDTGR